MNWAYMNKILTRWYEAGLMNAEQIKQRMRDMQVEPSVVTEGQTAQVVE
jgi:DNA replication protein DnaD